MGHLEIPEELVGLQEGGHFVGREGVGQIAGTADRVGPAAGPVFQGEPGAAVALRFGDAGSFGCQHDHV